MWAKLRRTRTPTRPSLVRRLIVGAAAWSLPVLMIAGLSLSIFFSHESVGRFDDNLSETVLGLVTGTSVDNGEVAAPPLTDARATHAYSGEYWEIATPGPDGVLHALVRSRSLWDGVLGPPPGGATALTRSQGKTLFYDSPGPLGQPLRVAAEQVRLQDLNFPVVFMAAKDRTPVDEDVRDFVVTFAIALSLLGAGLIAAVFAQVRFGLQPLFALRGEVAGLRTGRSDRVTGTYPTELEPLATELNALMAHNQEVVERQRTHVGNLAHALKTPLSVMLTEARQQPGSLSEIVLRQTETMRQQVDHHLRRARAAARAQGQGERTPIAPVLEELSRTLEKIFRDKVSRVDWDCPDDLNFLGERQDLLEIAGNVMENACKWCAGRVRVDARPLSTRQFRLVVEDDGPGLAAEQRAEVLRRGARLDESAPGSGLGLSIVDELARAYGGRLTLGASSMGGLKLEIVLPRAEG